MWCGQRSYGGQPAGPQEQNPIVTFKDRPLSQISTFLTLSNEPFLREPFPQCDLCYGQVVALLTGHSLSFSEGNVGLQ
jgi:hypothetical protein